ncbi:hypothetical protein HanLR1_Chr09g0337451 [Helianthus annuus]|nr:hypothetical protein HanLR1_Chr09g0337451 [Helianthus annuus]
MPLKQPERRSTSPPLKLPAATTVKILPVTDTVVAAARAEEAGGTDHGEGVDLLLKISIRMFHLKELGLKAQLLPTGLLMPLHLKELGLKAQLSDMSL